MSKRVAAVVDLSAISDNLEFIRQKAEKSQVLAMVKADAYGHGAGEVARALSDRVDAFGVATLDEAIELRDMGILCPIVLLEGFNFPHELAVAKEHSLDLVIHNIEQLSLLLTECVASVPRLWVKLDTGMHRLGFSKDEWQAARLLINQSELSIETVLMTHLACADEIGHPLTVQQINSFDEWVSESSSALSVANSAAILSLPDVHYDWVRPGIMLYGVSPFGARKTAVLEVSNSFELEAEVRQLKPAMSLYASIIALKHIPAGDSIGYGATFQCVEPKTIAVVSIGYGDGYPRSAPSGTPCYLNGVHSELVGRVSMDMLTIDVTHIPDVKLGDQVELWGNNVAVEDVAEACNTIAYELLTGLTGRVPVNYIR